MGIHVLGAHAVTTDNRGRVLARQVPECGARGGPALPPGRVFGNRPPDAEGLCRDCADLVGLG